MIIKYSVAAVALVFCLNPAYVIGQDAGTTIPAGTVACIDTMSLAKIPALATAVQLASVGDSSRGQCYVTSSALQPTAVARTGDLITFHDPSLQAGVWSRIGLLGVVQTTHLPGVGQTTPDAGTTFEVEYVSGHAGKDEKEKGLLSIGDTTLTFTGAVSGTAFRIALREITEVSSQTDIRDASVGKKLLLGAFAGSRKQDFVQVTYETRDLAEGIVFKVKQNTSPGVVAKIRFAIKKLGAEVPNAPNTSSRGVPPR